MCLVWVFVALLGRNTIISGSESSCLYRSLIVFEVLFFLLLSLSFVLDLGLLFLNLRPLQADCCSLFVLPEVGVPVVR